MHKVSAKYLRPGMIVGQGIYHTSGTFLLKKGTCLNETYIRRLRALDISSLYVTSSNTTLQIQPPPDVIQESTRIQAIKDVYDTFQNCQLTNSIDVKVLRTTADSILNDLFDRTDPLVQISDIRLHDNYTFSHSVNVAVLATLMGRQLNYTKSALADLTLGALLHDIGKIRVPASILNKPTRLTFEEEEIMRMHPEDGFRMLHKTSQFSSQIMHIVLGHHEKFDSSGYPRHLSGEKIHEYARIVAIADVYDALTSERSYKKPYTPFLAHSIMTKCTSGHFDPNLIQRFFTNIAIYPVGSILKINIGYAIVKKIHITKTLLPVIVLFADSYKSLLPGPETIDLSTTKIASIEYELDEHEITNLMREMKIDPAQYICDN